MDVSILIVNWNSRDCLQQCISSITTHTHGVRYEIIVIDGASYDGCDVMLRDNFPHVRFIQCAENVGFARCNNLAFEASVGQAILLLNPDTELLNPAVNVLLSHVGRLPAAGLLGARLLNSDGSVQTTSILPFPTLTNQLLGVERLRRRWPRSRLWKNAALADQGSEPQEVEAVSGACLLVSRRVFDMVGRFSDDYFMYAEDVDLAFKARRAGLRNYHVPGAVVVHHGGSSSALAGSAFSSVMLREANARFLRKTRGPMYAAAYKMAMLVAGVGRLAVLAPIAALRPGARGDAARHSMDKWLAVTRWGVGQDGVVERHYGRQRAVPSSCPSVGGEI